MNFCKGIALYCAADAVVAEVSVYLCGGYVGVSEKLFKGQNVRIAVLVHKRCGCVAELMGGNSLSVKSCFFQRVLHDLLNASLGDTRITAAYEQSRLIDCLRIIRAYRHVSFKSVHAGGIEVHHALLASLSKNLHALLGEVDIPDIDPDKLAQTHTAVEKQRQDAVISDRIAVVRRIKEFQALVKREELRKSAFWDRNFYVLDWIVCKQVSCLSQVLEKAPQRRNFTVARTVSIAALIGSIENEVINIAESYPPQFFNRHGRDIDVLDVVVCAAQYRVKIFQKKTCIEIVFLNSPVGQHLHYLYMYQIIVKKFRIAAVIVIFHVITVFQTASRLISDRDAEVTQRP